MPFLQWYFSDMGFLEYGQIAKDDLVSWHFCIFPIGNSVIEMSFLQWRFVVEPYSHAVYICVIARTRNMLSLFDCGCSLQSVFLVSIQTVGAHLPWAARKEQ